MDTFDILLVEDDPNWQEIIEVAIKVALEAHGKVDITILGSYDLASNALKKRQWHLLVTDIGLGSPHTSLSSPLGKYLIEKASERGIPAIAVSGTPSSGQVARDILKECHAHDFFSKQEFRKPDFISTIQDVLLHTPPFAESSPYRHPFSQPRANQGSLNEPYSTGSSVPDQWILNNDTHRNATHYDVFLCHNLDDKEEIREIARSLRSRNILPWLDEEQIRPGFPWQEVLEHNIKNINSAAIFIGSSGIGPWQNNEIRALLDGFVLRSVPIIPVILRSAKQKPELPIFLRRFSWVDFRYAKPNPLDQLVWGITGKHSSENP